MKKLVIVGDIISEVIKLPNGQMAKYSISETLVSMLSSPSNPAGANFGDMSKLVGLIRKVTKAIEAKKSSILLEQSDFKVLVESLKAFRFQKIDPSMVDWIESIEQLPNVPVEETGANKAVVKK